MNKQKVKEIVKFSIRQNMQNKWFVIFNIFIFLFVLVMTNSSNISQFLENNNIQLFDDEVTIEYIDKENLLGNKIVEAFEEHEKIEVKQIDENNYTKETIPDNLLVVEVKSDENKILTAVITSKEGMDSVTYDEILTILEDTRLEVLAKKINAKESDLENLNTEVAIERVMLGVDAENSETKEMIQYVSTLLVYMISIFIFSKIANEIAQEKVSKSIEYVLTSVTAKEYLLAKIISNVAVVLIQAMYMLAYYFIGNLISTIITLSSGLTLEGVAEGMVSSIDRDIAMYILIVFVYAVLTIILMAIIQAALSSKTTSMSEAGNTMTFLMTVTIAVYMLTFVLINPYTNMTAGIYILSCIPLVSNYFIPAIIIIGQATNMQIFISLALLIISIPIAFNICAKIFKNGVLDYKSNNKKKKVKKELTLKEEQELKLAKSEFKKLAFVIGSSIILMIVLQFVIQIVMQIVVTPMLTGVIEDSQINIITMMINSILSMLLPALFVLLYTKQEKTEVHKKNTASMFFVSVFLVGIIQILLILVQKFFGLENSAVEQILDIEGLDNVFTMILFVIEIAVIPAIFEELYFRKALISFTRKFGDAFAIIISSLIFAAIHMNITQGIFAFLMGLVLGKLYLETGNMKLNMLIHGLNNGYAAIGTILLVNNFEVAYLVLDIIVLALIVIGGIVFISKLIKKIKQKEKLINIKGKILPDNFKYVFLDFSFVISIIFIVSSFVATEALLKML